MNPLFLIANRNLGNLGCGYGIGRSESMHVYLEKLINTTLPRSDFVVSGLELSHPTAPAKSGMDAGVWLCEKSNAATKPVAIAKAAILMVIDFLAIARF